MSEIRDRKNTQRIERLEKQNSDLRASINNLVGMQLKQNRRLDLLVEKMARVLRHIDNMSGS